MNKEKNGMKILFIVMIISLAIGYLWTQSEWLRNLVHKILDPTIGVLLQWNLVVGMIILVFVLTLITTLFQKYGTDQVTLRELKKEQKILQEETKKYKEHPEKLMDANKKGMELMLKTMPLTMRPIIFTATPFILLFGWFNDFFLSLENPKIFGMNWLLFYLIASIIASIILRKLLDVA